VSDRPKTLDFGAPDNFGAHLFRVEIPASRKQPVVIVEDYGYRGQEAGIPRDEERVVLKRPVWSAIADIARREFNDRLKAAKVLTGRWHTGTNLVDRLLGKELCELAWAARRRSTRLATRPILRPCRRREAHARTQAPPPGGAGHVRSAALQGS